MADQKKPLQDGEMEQAGADADTGAASGETLAEQANDAENALQDALNELDALLEESEDGSQNADAETEADTSEQTDAPAEEDASGKKKLSFDLKKPDLKLPDSLKKKDLKKKEKKKVPQRTEEEELADLAEEEAQFDEWGRPIRKKKRRRKRKKTRKLSCTLVLLTAILAMSSVLSVAILAVAKEMYGIDKDIQEKIIIIPEGATTASIAEQLVQEEMISLPEVFRLVSRMNGMDGSYIAGEHVISASMSYETMIEELCHNYEEDNREYVRVTFREGITLMDAAKILQENEVCSADNFMFFFNSGNFGFEFEKYLPEKNSLKFQQMEGYCFPDTYEFYVGEEPNIVAQKIYANFDSKLTEGDYRKMQELGMSLDEVITLASIVQGEAPFPDSMKMVASVFHNRLLNRGMFPKLQSDPTRKYAEDVIAPNLEVNNETMITAYNTYDGTGLPPGAINNPGRDAIEAVLYPADSNYYFFNANIDTGAIYYATTNEEHEANLQRVQAEYAEAEAAANGEGNGDEN